MQRIHGFFIAGTDTGIGKTVVSAWLAHHLKADYWKPVQTGDSDTLSGEVSDTQFISEIFKNSPQKVFPAAYSLKAPLSPHIAAPLEGVDITLDKIVKPQTDNLLIVEGAGGIYTPLTPHQTFIDLMKKICSPSFPIIVVAENRLGAINQTCTTLTALRHHNLPVAGVILNGPIAETQIHQNKRSIEYYGQTKVLAELDRLPFVSLESLDVASLSPSFSHLFDYLL